MRLESQIFGLLIEAALAATIRHVAPQHAKKPMTKRLVKLIAKAATKGK